MILLYTSPVCPYCHVVRDHLDESGIPYEVRDIASDPTYRDELVTKGGKLQIPFLVDTEHDVALYESADIVEYLQKTYGEEK